MSFMPVILWSDALVFLLLAAGISCAWYVRQHEHLLLPWRRVAQNPTAMVSLLVLSLFLLVGLLDTLHYRVLLPENNNGQKVYSPEVLSVFDKLLAPLRTHTEKTYSAPLAMTLYAKESISEANGLVSREYPRLRYGGAHLSDPQQRDGDVLKRGLSGALAGLLAGLLIALSGKRPLARHGWPVRPLLIATLIIFTVIGMTADLAGAYHVLGTDKVGQDVLYLSLKSIRTGLIIGTVTTLVTLPLALLLGIAAGYLRGWVDDVIQYIYTVLSSIPSVLLIAAAVLMMQVTIDTHPQWFDTSASRADLRLVFLCLILGVTSWTGLCRLLRGETLKLREMEYIQAAQAFGVPSLRILTRHILPNVMHIVLISLVMDFSGLVLAEAVLSYVGVGVDPSMISFGTMINAARLEMGRDPVVWWALASAFGFMLALVLAANLFADAVRDAFDPRLNRSAVAA
ncbi:MAG: Binding-protein-dependent transport systems inner membrane component [Candidatus Gallionella acididurans]|uniref:Binding-protein-dependent transport systems inner membrane component n=1 Tax=Candidatus Gallionella acididurans TaxID=1796491 RepID=A0A139BQP8_9PROT|nr:MAG: Binding-protein-dependent transport systems inner membrane component [Candidatus Gallionella acididurans]